MEQKFYYVAIEHKMIVPSIVEKFYNRADAESYAALMCRVKKLRYIVLEQLTEWDGASLTNA